MSKDVEDRLRQALASRAEQVTAESLRPAEVPQATRSGRQWPTSSGSWWTTWRTPMLAAAATATALGGLVLLSSGRDVRTPPTNAPAVVTGSSCEREGALVTAALEESGVSVDVDGDGVLDRVATAVDGKAGPKCRAFVAVRTATGTTYSTALAAFAVPSAGVDAEIIGVPDLGADGKADVVVDTHLMADGALAQLFTLTEDGLERVVAPGFEDGNFVVQGGGVTAPQAAGCTADGSLLLSMATSDSQGRDFTVTRKTYPVTGTPLRFGSPHIDTGQASATELSARFPEFGTDNFASCGGDIESAP